MAMDFVKPLHIAIDARMYGTAQRGIGRYLMKLIENLEIVDRENQYTIFLRRANFEEYQPKNPRFKKAIWDAPWYGWKEQFTRYTLHVTRYDLVHFPHWNIPLFFNRPFIVTIHDLELFSSNRTRENSTRGRFVYWFKFQAFKIIFRHAVLAARRIIVPSNIVREQLLDLYPQTRKKVHVIHEAPTITSGTRYTLHVTRYTPYVLYVGAAYPHKNLPRLLEAWQIVHKELPGYKLVLVGREDWFWKRLKENFHHSEQSEESRANARPTSVGDPSTPLRSAQDDTSGVIFYGEASDAELSALYQNASLLVQPSLEEGFSLPPLEALSFDCPVAVSDIPIHREILDDAAIFFDPKNIPAMAEIIKNALINKDISAQLLARAKTLLLKYSWQAHAQQTLTLYQSIASQSRGNSVK